jgi:hypothetical protein
LRDPLGWRKEEIVKRKRERAKGKERRGKALLQGMNSK